MIITLSPAKLLNFESPISCEKKSKPLYEKEADELYASLKNATTTDIAKLMNINPQLAYEVHQYIQAFPMKRTPQRQAIFAYNGIAYQGLDAKTLTNEDLDFAQKHLVHISGLYGMLRPLDLINPKCPLELSFTISNGHH